MNSQLRRSQILEHLHHSDTPLSATWLAHTLEVSRQIIVGDVALLRASGANIIATPRGYVLDTPAPGQQYTVACRHSAQDMEQELNLMVDHGCTVESVVVEHPVYGQLVGQLNLSSRYDVTQFVQKAQAQAMRPLSDLTGGIHLHTLRCKEEAAFHQLEEALRRAGFLVEES